VSKSRRIQDHILLSQLRLPQLGGPSPRIYIPREQGVPVVPQCTGIPFYRLLRLSGLRWRYSNLLPQGSTDSQSQNQSKSYITTDGQSASLTWCQAPIWDSWPILLLLSLIILDSYGLVYVGRPLWPEVGSTVFSFSWTTPVQPFSDLSLTGLMSIFYCLYFWDSPNLEGHVPVFISSRNRVARLYSRTLDLSN
jgi:hypothetical protein